MLIRSQKIALNPNNKQSTLLSQHARAIQFSSFSGHFREGRDSEIAPTEDRPEHQVRITGQLNGSAQHAGYARVAFNFGLSSFKSGLDKDEWRSYIDIKREFNAVKHDKFDWCSDLSQNASKNALHNLGDAVSRWKSGLLKNRKLAKALSDSALSRFLTMLKYKADRRGIPITEADQFFASQGYLVLRIFRFSI